MRGHNGLYNLYWFLFKKMIRYLPPLSISLTILFSPPCITVSSYHSYLVLFVTLWYYALLDNLCVWYTGIWYDVTANLVAMYNYHNTYFIS